MQRGCHVPLSSSVARGEHVRRRHGVDNGQCRFARVSLVLPGRQSVTLLADTYFEVAGLFD